MPSFVELRDFRDSITTITRHSNAGRKEVDPTTSWSTMIFLTDRPLRLTMRSARMFANEAIGSIFPARPASTAITVAACEGTITVPSISWVAGTLLTKFETKPTKRAE